MTILLYMPKVLAANPWRLAGETTAVSDRMTGKNNYTGGVKDLPACPAASAF
jgi:hypothetical protein